MISSTRRAFVAMAIAGIFATGCVGTAKLAPAGAYNATAFSLTLGRDWSDLTPVMQPIPPNVRYLSIDGPLLNRLYLGAGLKPGDSLIKLADKDAPRPTYRADMSDSELVEFVVDCVSALGFQSPEAQDLRTQDFGTLPGVRFDIATRTTEGLNISGTALVARSGDTLNVMLFLAPNEHYYGALLPEVETVFQSARPHA